MLNALFDNNAEVETSNPDAIDDNKIIVQTEDDNNSSQIDVQEFEQNAVTEVPVDENNDVKQNTSTQIQNQTSTQDDGVFPFVKENLKITTITTIDLIDIINGTYVKVGEEITERVNILPWRAIDSIEILLNGYLFKYSLISDLQTLESLGVDSEYLGISFDKQLTIHMTRPSSMSAPEDEMLFRIEIWDAQNLESIFEYSGFNNLTMILEWQQPNQELPTDCTIWKKMNATIVENGESILQESFLCKPTNTISVYVGASGEGQTSEYLIETDVQTLEGLGASEGFRSEEITFVNRVIVNVTPTPMGQVNVRLTISVSDSENKVQLYDCSGWNDLTLILEYN